MPQDLRTARTGAGNSPTNSEQPQFSARIRGVVLGSSRGKERMKEATISDTFTSENRGWGYNAQRIAKNILAETWRARRFTPFEFAAQSYDIFLVALAPPSVTSTGDIRSLALTRTARSYGWARRRLHRMADNGYTPPLLSPFFEREVTILLCC